MDELDRQVADVLGRTAAWTGASWAVGDRAAAMRATIQALADLGAAAQGRAARPVPRLADTVLPDQLAVMVHDLAAAPPAVRRQAAAVLSRR